jgi:hypothetical protein
MHPKGNPAVSPSLYQTTNVLAILGPTDLYVVTNVVAVVVKEPL